VSCVHFRCCCSFFSTFEFAARHKVVCMLTAVRGSGKPMMNNPQLWKPKIIVLRREARIHHATGNKVPKRAESTTVEKRPLGAARKSGIFGHKVDIPPKRKPPALQRGGFRFLSLVQGSPRPTDHNPVVTSIVLPSSRVT
jgi:hypothetical protein